MAEIVEMRTTPDPIIPAAPVIMMMVSKEVYYRDSWRANLEGSCKKTLQQLNLIPFILFNLIT